MNVQKSFFESIFLLRTSSFPAWRQSSSALSRAGNDRGLMTSTISVPLFGHQAVVNGLMGQRPFGFFCGGRTGTHRRADLQQEAGTVSRSCSLCTLYVPCRYSDHGALILSQSKDFLIAESACVFCVVVAVKKTLRWPLLFSHLPGYRAESEPCRNGSAKWRIPNWRHLRRAEVTGHLEAQDASLISLLAFTWNFNALGRLARCLSTRQERRQDSAFALAMHWSGRRGYFCWREFFSLRTSSFPARRKSSSALSSQGNGQGFMTNTVQAPLFGHQAGINGLIG